MTRTSVRRCLVAGASVAMVATTMMGIQGSPTTAAPTQAQAADPPPLSVRAAASKVTLWRYGKSVELNLGTWAVAGNDPFELTVTRPTFNKPVRGVWHGAEGDVTLPKRMVSNFRGLKNFSTLTIRNAKGKKVLAKTQTFCPNGYTTRIRPDAPAVSHYPEACGGRLPFKYGAVWGFESGHGVRIPAGYQQAKLKPGKYIATVRITKDYRSLLGITKAQGTAQVNVRVRNHKDCDGPGHCRAAREAAPTDGIAQPSGRPTGPQRVPDAGPRPDLRSVPAWGIQVRKGKFLAFSATVWNAGNSPLVVDGYRRKSEAVMDAYQYFFNADGDQTGYDQVGTMEWDPREDHMHWHFQDFALYRLVDKDKKAVVRSKKEAFCLANTDAVDYTIDGANWQPDNTDLETACGEADSLGLREVLDAGSGDTYEQFRPGQSFRLKGIPNGTYFIEVRANPVQNLTESDLTNNVAYRKVIIRGKSGARTVKVPPVGLIDHP